MCKLANASPQKQEIINDCLGHFNFASKSIPQRKPKLSVIQLQMLRRQNRVMEHKQIIENIKSEYGSIEDIIILNWVKMWCPLNLLQDVVTI